MEAFLIEEKVCVTPNSEPMVANGSPTGYYSDEAIQVQNQTTGSGLGRTRRGRLFSL